MNARLRGGNIWELRLQSRYCDSRYVHLVIKTNDDVDYNVLMHPSFPQRQKTMPVAWKMSPPPPHFGNRRRTKLFKQKRLQQKRAVGDSEAFLLPFSELRRVPVRQVAIAVMDHYVWQLQHTIIIALFILSTEVPVQRGNWYLIPHSHVWSASLAL